MPGGSKRKHDTGGVLNSGSWTISRLDGDSGTEIRHWPHGSLP